MNSFEIEGRVKVIMDTMTFKSGFKKREFVVTSFEAAHAQDIKFEALGRNVEMLEHIKEGDPLKITFEIRGNEYQGRYFVNLQIKRIERAGKGPIDTAQKSEKIEQGEPFEGVDLDNLDDKISAEPSKDPSLEDDELPF